jgi:sugar lactone lactonase YvrE
MPRVYSYLSVLVSVLALPLTAQQALPSGYLLQTLAGGDSVGDGGQATAALLIQSEGVAADTRGNIYISDAGTHRVRKIAANGIISTLAGNGHPGFNGDGGPASSAQLRTPYGLAIDRNGNLYIADLGNARIRRVTPDGVISTFAGGGTLAAAQADGRFATDAALNAPRNVALDFYGVLYFSDFGGHRVYQVSPSGTLNVFAGTGEPGYSGDGGFALRAQVSSPSGMAVDASGAVYIADSGNGRIRRVYRGVIGTLGDGGNAGSTSSISLSMPVGLALDPDGSLFIADTGANSIIRVTPALAITPMTQAARDIVIDVSGNLYACSGGVVSRRPRGGAVTVFAGEPFPTHLGDGGPLLDVQFATPGGIVRDGDGNLYIADTGHHRIRKINATGGILTVAGNGIRGFAGDGGSAILARLDTPVGVAVDRTGNLYIGDSGNHRIRRIDTGGIISTLAGSDVRGHSPDGIPAVRAQLDTPTWLAIDGEGAVYFSETGAHTVRKVAATGILGTVAGTGLRGFKGDGGAAISANLDSPQGIALDSAGNLYIADAGNRRIRYVPALNPAGPSSITTVPDAGAAIWRSLRGLAVDARGSIFAADADDHRVFRIDPAGNVLTIAGTGAADFTAESGAGLSQALTMPTGVALDNTGNVYLADAGNRRIRKLTPSLDSIETPLPVEPRIAVVSAASLQPTSIAPGELVSIFGAALGPATGISAAQPTVEIGGTQVLFNGRLAPMFYAGQNQLNVQVPYSLGDARTCNVRVLVNGVLKARTTVNVVDTSPSIFTTSGGAGQAAALNEDGSLNSQSNPAERGSIVVFFATGEGETNPRGRGPGFLWIIASERAHPGRLCTARNSHGNPASRRHRQPTRRDHRRSVSGTF